MKPQPESWKRKSSRDVADCRVFKVREDFNEREGDGKSGSFFIIESPDWVNVVALTSENEVVLIEQFRHGIREMILEIPGGIIDDDEEAESAAKRELLEETGYSADDWVFLGKSYPNPATQNNTIYHYLARRCKKTEETSFDEHESITVQLSSLDDVKELIKSGRFTHSLAVAAFLYFDIYEKSYENITS